MADTICVEVSSISTGKTVGGIPSLAKRLTGRSEWSRVENAVSSSRIQYVPSIARGAEAIAAVPGVAEIRNGSADLVGVKVKSSRAGKAGVVATPGETARVDLILSSDDLTRAIVEAIAFVTGLADSLSLIELTALGRDLAADSLGIEEEALGAL